MGFMMVAVDPGIESLFACYPGERLTPEQVAEAIGQTPYTVRRQLRSGDLPGYRIGSGTKASWMCVKSEVIALLRSRWNQPDPREQAHPTRPGAEIVATSPDIPNRPNRPNRTDSEE
ncbi:helix-turn-helix domain-containing protein [Kribbella sp. NPDC048928]|uniref:helix-turn-helix domain-containing protein n=1 Tax=Kribbella sp. NPDC048928 TaxID=3364111 RepID=UPI0037113BA3